MDEAGFPERWEDPLRVTDRYGRNTDVLRNFLQGTPAFLVLGGPSINKLDYMRLTERGIFSLGVNNVGGYVPVNAWTCSDPPMKFHHGIFLDPQIMKILPIPKLCRKRGKLRLKRTDNGCFEYIERWPENCPNVWGYERRSWMACDQTWFIEKSAAWGNQSEGVRRLGETKVACTMLLGMRLLIYLGAREIYLLGADFWMDPKAPLTENYCFGEDRDMGAIRSNNYHYEVVNRWLLQLAPWFQKFGIGVYNCNQKSRLRAFQYVPFDVAMERCRGLVPAEAFDLNKHYCKLMDPSNKNEKRPKEQEEESENA